MAQMRQDFKDLLGKKKKVLTEAEQSKLEQVINEIVQGDGTLPLKDALGFTPADLEGLYNFGYKLFQSGKYQEALPYFIFLRQLDISSYRYSFGIAACYQHLKDYTKAAANYLFCTYLDMANPMPYFHMYHCFMNQGDVYSAFQTLKETILCASDQPAYAELKEKAKLEMRKLKQEIKHSSEKQNPALANLQLEE